MAGTFEITPATASKLLTLQLNSCATFIEHASMAACDGDKKAVLLHLKQLKKRVDAAIEEAQR